MSGMVVSLHHPDALSAVGMLAYVRNRRRCIVAFKPRGDVTRYNSAMAPYDRGA